MPHGMPPAYDMIHDKRPATWTLGVRLTREERLKLDSLCAATGQNAAQMIRTLIALAEPPTYTPVRLGAPVEEDAHHA